MEELVLIFDFMEEMEMVVDRRYCMSSFLMYRTIVDTNKQFAKGYEPQRAVINEDRIKVHNSEELFDTLKKQVELFTKDGKAAVALSGGIDSAIVAKMMPRGSTAYTFKCVVPGIEVVDETPMAAKYAEECGLKHKIVEIYWEDMESLAPTLMKRKGAPIHSIEVQIYKAALQVKEDGFKKLIFGESSDVLYGGLSQLLSRDWTIGEFINRYSYVMPYMVLKDPIMILDPYYEWEKDGKVDVHGFNSHFFYAEGLGSYLNACSCAEIEFCGPFSNTVFADKLDLKRIRNGENKYIVREVFKNLYPGYGIPEKTPMPRPVNEWFRNWSGPTRNEFWSHCTDNMTGDQKWLVYILEKFLNMVDGIE